MSSSHGRSAAKTLEIYKICALEASKALLKNPWIVFCSFGAYFVYSLASGLFSGMGYAGGLLVGMLQIGLVSLYYYWLSEVVGGRRVRLEATLFYNFQFFSGVISVAFIFFVGLYLAQLVLLGMQLSWAVLLLQLGIVFVFNAIPEVIYLKNIDGVEGLSYAARFTKENWIEWYLPLLILLLPWLFRESSELLLVIAATDPFLPSLMLIQSAGHWTQALSSSAYPGFFLGIVLTNWFMVFRANLFLRLD